MPDLIKAFDVITEDHLESFGEKAKGIIQLHRLGLMVPAGFVINKEAYNSFIQVNGIYAKILQTCKDTSNSEDDRIAMLGAPIRSIIQETDLQDRLVEEIDEAFRNLQKDMNNSHAVAVRSSIVAHNKQPFRYEVDTFLNIRESAQLIQGIKGCWASLWTDWAVSQREQHGILHQEAQIGVIVQEMINAESSGVLYIGNPVTGSEDEIVIDACWGLGEGASQGRTDTDNYIINKYSFSVQENISRKNVMMVPNDRQGTIEKEVPLDKQEHSVLDSNQLQQFSELGIRVERAFGSRQKIEWAWYKDQPFILQISPINVSLI